MDELANSTTRAIDPAVWVDEHGDYLYRYALSRLRDPEASEEVVQETFVAALRAVGQFTGRGTERAWLLGILKRKIVDSIRQRNRNVAGDDIASEEELLETLFDHRGKWRVDPRLFGQDPSAALEKHEFWTAFRACLEGVPGRQADAFVLREMDGKGTDEVCKELNITPSNLWVLLHRARLRLANCLRKRWQTEGGTTK